MTAEQLEALLADVAAGRLLPAAALERLRHLPFEDLPFARIDHHRALRQGIPEVVFCEGKTVDQVVAICERLEAATGSFLGTRAISSLEPLRSSSLIASGLRKSLRCIDLIRPSGGVKAAETYWRTSVSPNQFGDSHRRLDRQQVPCVGHQN